MAPEKCGIWTFIFPDREISRNLPKILRKVSTQGIYLQQREIFEVIEIKVCTMIMAECC